MALAQNIRVVQLVGRETGQDDTSVFGLSGVDEWVHGGVDAVKIVNRVAWKRAQVDEGLFVDRAEIVEATVSAVQSSLLCCAERSSQLQAHGVVGTKLVLPPQGNRSVLIPAAATCGEPAARGLRRISSFVFKGPCGRLARLEPEASLAV